MFVMKISNGLGYPFSVGCHSIKCANKRSCPTLLTRKYQMDDPISDGQNGRRQSTRLVIVRAPNYIVNKREHARYVLSSRISKDLQRISTGIFSILSTPRRDVSIVYLFSFILLPPSHCHVSPSLPIFIVIFLSSARVE